MSIGAVGVSVNSMGPLRISRQPSDPRNTFRLGATSGVYTTLTGLSPWVSGGFITEYKEPRQVHFRYASQMRRVLAYKLLHRSLEDCIAHPQPGDGALECMGGDFVMTDMTNMCISSAECQLHGTRPPLPPELNG